MDSIEILKHLIEIDTTNPPGNERNAAVYLSQLLEPYGFVCEIQELGDNRANFIASLGIKSVPELVMNGHLDVVPATGEWKTEPFRLSSHGKRLYGRGTSDMKGGIAAMCEAAIRIAKSGGPVHGKLKLLFVADEECSNLGTESYLKKFAPGDYVVIGEPTLLKVAVAHRGVSRDYIDFKGKARHAALLSEEESSIEQTAKAIVAVKKINEKLQTWSHEVLPPPSIAITMLKAYEKDNIIPAVSRLLLDFRILPGMDKEKVYELLDQGFAEAGLGNYEKIPHFYMPGGEISIEDPFVKLCLKEREKVLGDRVEPCAFEASCEQCFFTERGAKAVICGPGDISQAHTLNEYIEEQQVRQAADLYESIMKWVLIEENIE